MSDRRRFLPEDPEKAAARLIAAHAATLALEIFVEELEKLATAEAASTEK